MGLSYSFPEEEYKEDKELLAFIDNLARVYDEVNNNGTWILNPSAITMLSEAAKMIRKSLAGQNVTVEVQPFGEESHIGTITITSRELIVFKNPKLVAELGKKGIGIDFTSYQNGETEVIFSFMTATKFRKDKSDK